MSPRSTSDDLETVPCALCGADDAANLFVASDDRYGTAGEFPVVRCCRCGLVYVNPRPSAVALGRYYPEAYAPHRGEPQHASRVGAAMRALVFAQHGGPVRAAGAWLYNSLAYRAFVRRPAGRVLDIGCGTGDYLAAWAALGWAVEGIEPAAAAAAIARERLGAPIHAGFVEDIKLDAEAYDAIAMSHSFEHVRSPRDVLAIVHRALAPDGRLVLMLPNFAAWDRRAFGTKWYGLEVPRHLYHFEPATLAALLGQTGFAIEQLGGSSHADGALRAILGRPARPGVRALAGLALLPVAALRRTTSMWAIARRA